MNLGSMEQRTEGIKRQAQELIEQAYQIGYNAGYEEGKGQTWSEEVKKYEIEPDKKNECIEKLRAYEEQKKQEEDSEIHVGDEVVLSENLCYGPNAKVVVISFALVGHPYNVMFVDGNTAWIKEDDIACKTGRSFPEILEVSKKLREEK